MAPGQFSPATQTAPVVGQYGKEAAQLLEGGERVVMAAAGLTASVTAVIYLQIGLYLNRAGTWGQEYSGYAKALQDDALATTSTPATGNGNGT
jgi:hypothetical protein